MKISFNHVFYINETELRGQQSNSGLSFFKYPAYSYLMISLLETTPDFHILYKPEDMDFHTNQGVAGFFSCAEKLCHEKLYPVHRLDKVTSGLIILARHSEAAALFGQLFESHTIRKSYLAVAQGKPRKKQGLISGDMERSRRGSWKLCRTKKNPAVTRFYSYSLKPGYRIYWLQPQTGKTHQLRTAMKSLGTAILGDRLYGANESDRVYLHACKLEFIWGGRSLCYSQRPETGQEFLTEEFRQSVETIISLSTS